MIDKCFYINLDRRVDRRKYIESELSKSKILSSICSRFSAIDGSQIHPRSIEHGILTENAIDDVLQETTPSWGLSITQGGLGIILSYLKLFKLISDSNSPCVTIEDDVELANNFDEKFTKIINDLPVDFDICYLGYGDTNIETRKYSPILSIPIGRVVCLPGLIISPNGAKKLLSICKNLDNQIDTAISTKFNELNVFVVNDQIVKIKNALSSDIQGDVNCRKKYKRQNYIFSTLAIGDIAVKNATLLSRDLKYFDQKIIVVTDNPTQFESQSNVIVVEHRPKKFSYNDKLICIREGLSREDAVVCIDSDCRILYKTFKNATSKMSLIISPGFHPSWDWGKICRPGNKFFNSEDVTGRVSGYGELALKLCTKLDINYLESYHYQEGIVVVCKDGGKETTFIDTWSVLATNLDNHEVINNSSRIGIGEGNLIGLALTKSGMKINSTEICNILGENIKYNFYGSNREDQLRKFLDRKIVQSSTIQDILSKTIYVEFNSVTVKLEFTVGDLDDVTRILTYKWNQNNVVEFLDHEFNVNGNIFHFQSDKTGEFYFKKSEELKIYHTYCWYGNVNWKLIHE